MHNNEICAAQRHSQFLLPFMWFQCEPQVCDPTHVKMIISLIPKTGQHLQVNWFTRISIFKFVVILRPLRGKEWTFRLTCPPKRNKTELGPGPDLRGHTLVPPVPGKLFWWRKQRSRIQTSMNSNFAFDILVNQMACKCCLECLDWDWLSFWRVQDHQWSWHCNHISGNENFVRVFLYALQISLLYTALYFGINF